MKKRRKNYRVSRCSLVPEKGVCFHELSGLGGARPIKSVRKYSFSLAQYQCSASHKQPPFLIIVMHFLRALVFSAVVYASAAFAATIRIGGGGCEDATTNDIEIDIKVYQKQLAEVSEQLVFPMINSPPNTDIHVIVCIYAFSKFHTSLSKNDLYCLPVPCFNDDDCKGFQGCNSCHRPERYVSLTRVGIIQILICMLHSARVKYVKYSSGR